MTDEAMSPLRRRMIEDMTIRKLAPKTQQGYTRTVKDFAAFLGRSPDTASLEDVRRFQLHLAKNGAHAPILDQRLHLGGVDPGPDAARSTRRESLKPRLLVARALLAIDPAIA